MSPAEESCHAVYPGRRSPGGSKVVRLWSLHKVIIKDIKTICEMAICHLAHVRDSNLPSRTVREMAICHLARCARWQFAISHNLVIGECAILGGGRIGFVSPRPAGGKYLRSHVGMLPLRLHIRGIFEAHSRHLLFSSMSFQGHFRVHTHTFQCHFNVIPRPLAKISC